MMQDLWNHSANMTIAEQESMNFYQDVVFDPCLRKIFPMGAFYRKINTIIREASVAGFPLSTLERQVLIQKMQKQERDDVLITTLEITTREYFAALNSACNTIIQYFKEEIYPFPLRLFMLIYIGGMENYPFVRELFREISIRKSTIAWFADIIYQVEYLDDFDITNNFLLCEIPMSIEEYRMVKKLIPELYKIFFATTREEDNPNYDILLYIKEYDRHTIWQNERNIEKAYRVMNEN